MTAMQNNLESSVLPADTLKENFDSEKIDEIRNKIGEVLSAAGEKASISPVIKGPKMTKITITCRLEMRDGDLLKITHELEKALGTQCLVLINTKDTYPKLELLIQNPAEDIKEISLTELLVDENFSAESSKLSLILGASPTGKPAIVDLKKAPHILIVEPDEEENSSVLASIILSLLRKNKPTELKLVLIGQDEELSVYNNLPCLLKPNITSKSEASTVLTSVLEEMEKRYQILKSRDTRNIDEYNTNLKRSEVVCLREKEFDHSQDHSVRGNLEELPHLVIIVKDSDKPVWLEEQLDEDDSGEDFFFRSTNKPFHQSAQDLLTLLAQKGRAAGIHLIVITKGAGLQIFSPLLKINLPTRLCSKVQKVSDSLSILGEPGAEKLKNPNDMLFISPSSSLQLIHKVRMSPTEIEKIIQSV